MRDLLFVPAAAGVLAATAQPAAAQSAPEWLEAPTYAQAAAAYPAKAKAARVGGGVLLTCAVATGGALRDCAALSEQPGGMGFAGAARKIAQTSFRTSAPAHSEQRVTVAFTPEMADGAPFVASNAVWRALPSAGDFQAAIPKTENGVNNIRVALVCDVAAGGTLAGCAVEKEEPAGQGYGAAALALAPKFRVGLLSASGVPLVGAKVRVPIRYEMTPTKP
jgi:hypothetical protein